MYQRRQRRRRKDSASVWTPIKNLTFERKSSGDGDINIFISAPLHDLHAFFSFRFFSARVCASPSFSRQPPGINASQHLTLFQLGLFMGGDGWPPPRGARSLGTGPVRSRQVARDEMEQLFEALPHGFAFKRRARREGPGRRGCPWVHLFEKKKKILKDCRGKNSRGYYLFSMFTVYLFLEVEKKKTHESQMYEL